MPSLLQEFTQATTTFLERTGKISGAYSKLPFSMTVAVNYEYRNGTPSARTVALRGGRTIPNIVVNAEPIGSLWTPAYHLTDVRIEKNVAITSTLTVFETFTPGRPKPPGLEVLTPQLREQFETNYARTSQNKESIYSTLFPKGMALERAFASLHRLPAFDHLGARDGIVSALPRKHVRVAANELVANRVDRVSDGEIARLL